MYTVTVAPRVGKEIGKIASDQRPRVWAAIMALGENPRPHNAAPLTGRPGWKLRVGNYRVIYTVDDRERVVTIQDFGNRRDIYRWRIRMMETTVKYIEDRNGEPVAVVMAIDEYRQLLDKLEELESIVAFDDAMASDETPISLEEAMALSGTPLLERDNTPL